MAMDRKRRLLIQIKTKTKGKFYVEIKHGCEPVCVSFIPILTGVHHEDGSSLKVIDQVPEAEPLLSLITGGAGVYPSSHWVRGRSASLAHPPTPFMEPTTLSQQRYFSKCLLNVVSGF